MEPSYRILREFVSLLRVGIDSILVSIVHFFLRLLDLLLAVGDNSIHVVGEGLMVLV